MIQKIDCFVPGRGGEALYEVLTACPVVAHVLHAHVFRNESHAMLALFLVCLPLISVTLLLGRVHYWFLVIALAGFVLLMAAAGFFTTTLISTYFNKWGKGSTVAGIFNCLASLGIVAANSVVTGIADLTSWLGTAVVWVGLMILILLLTVALIPVWTKFIKKEFS